MEIRFVPIDIIEDHLDHYTHKIGEEDVPPSYKKQEPVLAPE